MRVNTNIASISAQNALYESSYAMEKSIEKLSTGLRINRASDDAAGLAVSENLRAQVRGLKMSSRNAQDGISALQIGEGSLNEVSSISQRMRELAVEASTDTLTNTERGYLNQEYSQLTTEIDRIINVSEFNGEKLLNGNWANKTLQIGANNSTNDQMTIAITSMTSTSIGINSTSIGTASNAQSAISSLDTAIDSVSSQRSNIGAYVNRLEHTVNNLNNSNLNVQSAESQIRDVDVGEEMANFTKTQILTQTGMAMLSQANATPSYALSLFNQ